MSKITKGQIGDLKILADYLKEKGIDVSYIDIIDFEEEDDKLKILIEGWVSIKSKESNMFSRSEKIFQI